MLITKKKDLTTHAVKSAICKEQRQLCLESKGNYALKLSNAALRVALSVPPSVLPSQLPLYMQDIRSHEGHNLSLSLELIDRERYGRLVQIKDVAQRVVYALSAGATRIDFPLPFQDLMAFQNRLGFILIGSHAREIFDPVLNFGHAAADRFGNFPEDEGA